MLFKVHLTMIRTHNFTGSNGITVVFFPLFFFFFIILILYLYILILGNTATLIKIYMIFKQYTGIQYTPFKTVTFILKFEIQLPYDHTHDCPL